MKLGEYLGMVGAKNLKEMSEESGVSYQTLKAVAKGMVVSKYEVAKRISDSAGNDPSGKPFISISDLCEE
jgi:hypothetical protein